MHQTLILLFFYLAKLINCKYLEGEIHTHNNWVFLARFCFLSEHGEFQYYLEFNEDQGVPNLLLYYDTDDQWPAIYKTNKNCHEKEAVLHLEQNQVINLTTKNDLAGCGVKPLISSTTTTTTITQPTTRKPTRKYPTRSTIKTTTPELPTPRTTTINENETTTTFFEDFSNTTELSKQQWENIHEFDSSSLKSTNHPIKKRAIPNFWRRTNKGLTIYCHNMRRFQSSRERWWFIALSNCNGTQGIHVKYRLWMTNGPEGDYWHEQFSADEFYILPVLMSFSIAYSFLLLGIIVCSIELKSRQLLHTTYKIFVFSSIFQLFGIILTSAAYLRYAVNGVGPLKTRRVGAIFMGVSETLYLLLLLLLAKGFTVTRGRLPLAASIKLTIFMCLYVVTYISIFIYEANVFDPGEVLYLYESPAGYSLICLRVLAWLMFIYSTIFTLKHYPEKSNFYYPFNICGTIWFVAGPAFILSANTYIDKWVRESVVCAVLQFISFGGHLTFLILTMPSVANKNFPYHVRTSQIGVMELSGIAGTSTIQQFGHHVYEPTGTIREQSVIVPLTRRTEEIFEGMYNQPVSGHTIRRESLDEEITNTRNLMMENVVSWSLAKNAAAITVPDFERYRRGSYVSDTSDTSRRSSLQPPVGNYNDYNREVPVQLFTVSRMVTETENEGKTV